MSSLINDGYKKPNETFTERLDEQDIKDKLSNYVKVDDIEELGKLPLGIHLRYFSIVRDKKNNITKKFRMGGFLFNKSNYEKYVVLTNNKKNWSVQSSSTIFYKKMSLDDVKYELETKLDECTKKLKLLKEENKELIKQKDKLIKFIETKTDFKVNDKKDKHK